jgi:hypothetical protein
LIAAAAAAMTKAPPSGAARATASMPMLPPAPVRFSTTAPTPVAAWMAWATKRAARSDAPPGVKGETMRTGPAGQGCARAGSASSAGAARIERRFMRGLP